MNIGTNAVISTYRLTEASDKHTYSGTATLTNVEAYIEQTDPKVAAIFGDAVMFKSFTMILDGTPDVKEYDKVVDNDGDTYIAYGVRKLGKNTDVPNQTEILMEKKYDGS